MLLLVGASVLANIHSSAVSDATGAHNLQPFEQAEEGDLVFRSGRDMISRLVLSQSDTPQFSHVGVIVKQGSSTMVIHALPKEGAFAGGVVIEPMGKFASMENASSVGLYRVEGLDAGKRGRVREYLFQQIGKPFDDGFSMVDDSKVYCTELVMKSYAAARMDLAGRVRRTEVMTIPEPVVLPDELSKSPAARLVLVLRDKK